MPRDSRSTPSLASWFAESTGWADAVLPEYDGGSIANLPVSVLQTFGVSTDLSSPLSATCLPDRLLSDIRVVVMIVIDGLGSENLVRARRRGATTWLDTAQHASAITSVFPSTTATALTSLQTGLSPAQHGMSGYTAYLTPQRATINMITWKPVGGLPTACPLPEPRSFLGVPNIYQHLTSAGVESTIVSHQAFSDSALTNIQSADVPYNGHRTMAEMAGLLLEEVRKPGKRFVFGYWDGFDTLAHTHGPDSDICLNEIYLLDQALGRGLVDPMSAGGAGDVAVILVADHGHTAIDADRVSTLKEVLSGRGGQRPIPTGDRRAMGLPFGSEDQDAVDALRDLASSEGVILSVDDAIAHGLYGPGRPHEDLASRIGETLLLATGDGAFVFPQSNNPTAGGHGSLSRIEMLVPLLVWRF